MTDLAMITVSANWTAMVKPSSSLPLAANHARFSELVEQTLAYARQIGASDAAAEVSEPGAVGLRAQERHRNRRADPRPLAGPDGLRRPEPRLCLDLRLFRGGAAPDGGSGLAHCPPYRRRPGGRPADADQLATEFPDLDLHHAWPVSTEEAAEAGPARRARAARRSIPASPIPMAPRWAPTKASSSWAIPVASWVATPIRATACRWRRSPRNGMQRDYWYTSEARSGPPGLARGRGSLCRRAHAVAPVGAPHSHRQVPGAVRGATGPGPGRRPRRRPTVARCTARPASCSTPWASRSSRRTST